MNLAQLPPWRVTLPLAGWLVILALLPWWLGLSLLCALVVALLLLGSPLDEGHALALRRGLRWGLPGMLLALQRALGGDVMAWGAALLGALAGYMLLVGMESWLDRAAARPASTSDATSVLMSGPAETAPEPIPTEWPARVMSSAMGPPVEIITLEWPAWHSGPDDWPDPWGGEISYRDGGFAFAGARRVDGVDAEACFSPDGRWFAAHLPRARGVLLWDRRHDRTHRLRGWVLAGWHRELPWLQRDAEAAPRPLAHVLGEEQDPSVD
ncbi:MAG: hypothetical protein ABI300_08105 [Rhodanobacter sp.]